MSIPLRGGGLVVTQEFPDANFIFYAHTLKGTRASEKQLGHFLQRAKYELDRIPEIRDEIIAGWKKFDSYRGEKDELISHMMAERQASVEGRMYLEAKQRSLRLEGFNPAGFKAQRINAFLNDY